MPSLLLYPTFVHLPQFSGFLGISPVRYSLHSLLLGSVWGLRLKQCSSLFCACLASASPKPSLSGLRHRVTAAASKSDSLLSSCCRSLGEAWAQVKKSLADEAEVHLKFSAKVTPPRSLAGLV